MAADQHTEAAFYYIFNRGMGKYSCGDHFPLHLWCLFIACKLASLFQCQCQGEGQFVNTRRSVATLIQFLKFQWSITMTVFGGQKILHAPTPHWEEVGGRGWWCLCVCAAPYPLLTSFFHFHAHGSTKEPESTQCFLFESRMIEPCTSVPWSCERHMDFYLPKSIITYH